MPQPESFPVSVAPGKADVRGRFEFIPNELQRGPARRKKSMDARAAARREPVKAKYIMHIMFFKGFYKEETKWGVSLPGIPAHEASNRRKNIIAGIPPSVIPAREALNRARNLVAEIQNPPLRPVPVPAPAHNAAWFNLGSGEEDRGAANARRAGMTRVWKVRGESSPEPRLTHLVLCA